MNKNDENVVYGFCDRLRKLRKHLNMTIEDLSSQTGLTFAQIQRIEGDTRQNNGVFVKKGGEGRVTTLIVLLNYYRERVSLDLLFNVNVPIVDLLTNKKAEKEIAKEKIQSLIPFLKEITTYLD